MLRKLSIILILVVISFCTSGCKKKSGETAAEQEITKENMASELEKIEKSLEEDISAEK